MLPCRPPKLLGGHETGSTMTTISKDANLTTFINVFTVEPGQDRAGPRGWLDAAEEPGEYEPADRQGLNNITYPAARGCHRAR